jgi:hypothetical protein
MYNTCVQNILVKQVPLPRYTNISVHLARAGKNQNASIDVHFSTEYDSVCTQLY